MAKSGQDFEAFLRNVITLRFTVIDQDDAEEDPLDISGLVLKWGLVQVDPDTGAFADSPLVLQKTTSSGITITNGPGGVCEVAIEDEDTEDLSPGTYYHQLEVFSGAGEDGVVVAEGTLTLKANLVEV